MIAALLAVHALAQDCNRPPAETSKVSSQLFAAYEADQKDRKDKNPDTAKNDSGRQAEVRKFMGKGWVCSGLDHYHSAVVLMHSSKADDVAAAYEHAKAAMAMHVPQGPWAVAATFDLWRVSRGMEQNYGTAVGQVKGRPCLYPVAADFSDADRATYGIEPLATSIQRVLKMAGETSDETTMRDLEKRGLVCRLDAWK